MFIVFLVNGYPIGCCPTASANHLPAQGNGGVQCTPPIGRRNPYNRGPTPGYPRYTLLEIRPESIPHLPM